MDEAVQDVVCPWCYVLQLALKASIWHETQIPLQGQADDELPEQLLGTVRLDHLDLGAATTLQLPEGACIGLEDG
jgi:hypothetical protein